MDNYTFMIIYVCILKAMPLCRDVYNIFSFSIKQTKKSLNCVQTLHWKYCQNWTTYYLLSVICSFNQL